MPTTTPPRSKQKETRAKPGRKPQLISAEPDEREAGSAFPIVGIGASAGGLEAFSTLLERLPADLGMALVLVQHLDPTHESMLTEFSPAFPTCRCTRLRMA